MRRLLPYLFVTFAKALFLYPFVRTFCDTPDAGVFLNGADLLNSGLLPSRDFVEPQGPGSFVWLALFFRIFGTSLAAARCVLLATGVGIGLLAFHLSRRLGASGLSAAVFAVAMSVPLLPINSPHYDSGLLALCGLAVFSVVWDRWLRGEGATVGLLVLCGVLFGVTTWMIQPKGFYVACAVGLSLLWTGRWQAWRPVAVFVGAYALTALTPFAWYAAIHALPHLLYANYIWPLSVYSDVNGCPYGFPAWRNMVLAIKDDAHQPIVWIPDVVLNGPLFLVEILPLALPIAAKLSGQQWFSRRHLPYWLAAYALWLGELHRLDIGHLRNGSLLMAILLFSICEASEKKALRRLGLLAVLCAASAAVVQYMHSWNAGAAMETRRGEMHAEPPQMRLVEFLERYTRAGDEVFIYPYQPIFYFVEKLRNPTRYSYMLYRFHTAAQFREAVQDLERKQVHYVVYDAELSSENFTFIFPHYQQPAAADLIMEPYLEAHYRIAKDLGRYRILERKP